MTSYQFYKSVNVNKRKLSFFFRESIFFSIGCSLLKLSFTIISRYLVVFKITRLQTFRIDIHIIWEFNTFSQSLVCSCYIIIYRWCMDFIQLLSELCITIIDFIIFFDYSLFFHKFGSFVSNLILMNVFTDLLENFIIHPNLLSALFSSNSFIVYV